MDELVPAALVPGGVSTSPTTAVTFCEGFTCSVTLTLCLDSVLSRSERDTSSRLELDEPSCVGALVSEVPDNADSISEIANSIFSRRMSASSISEYTSCSLSVASRIAVSSSRMIVSFSFSVRNAKLSFDVFHSSASKVPCTCVKVLVTELVSYPDPDSHSCGWITSPLPESARF